MKPVWMQTSESGSEVRQVGRAQVTGGTLEDIAGNLNLSIGVMGN